jgi:hypothetical protein
MSDPTGGGKRRKINMVKKPVKGSIRDPRPAVPTSHTIFDNKRNTTTRDQKGRSRTFIDGVSVPGDVLKRSRTSPGAKAARRNSPDHPQPRENRAAVAAVRSRERRAQKAEVAGQRKKVKEA